MDTYRMTFVNKKVLTIPFESSTLYSDVRKIILEKLTQNEFVLADFNWSGYYDAENIKSYLKKPYHCNSVMEICLDLDVQVMTNRATIYQRCITALKNNEVVLKHVEAYIGNSYIKSQSLIIFQGIKNEGYA